MRKSVIVGIGCFIAGIVVGKTICKKSSCINKFLTNMKKCACCSCSKNIDEEQDDNDDIDDIIEDSIDKNENENNINEVKKSDEVKE